MIKLKHPSIQKANPSFDIMHVTTVLESGRPKAIPSDGVRLESPTRF
jgi:hypothetical protein